MNSFRILAFTLCTILTSHLTTAQDCGCTLAQVENNSVEPCTTVYGITTIVSSAQEFRTAINQANASGGNMTILIEDGTYQVASTSSYPYITASNLVIRSVSGNRDNVVLTGTGMLPTSATENVLFAVGDNIIIADLTIKDCRNHGIAVSGDNLFVHNVKIQNTYEQMIKGVSSGDGSDNGRVQCSLLEYTAGIGPNWYIGGIDVHKGQDWIVRDNIFKDIASPSERVAEHAIHFWNSSSGIISERNMIINCDRGIGYGLGSSPASGGIIRNNMIYNDGLDQFADVGIGLESCPDTKVYNNTVFTQYTNAIEYRFASTTNVMIANNLTNGLIRSRNGGTATLTTNYTSASSNMYVNVSEGNLRLVEKTANISDVGTALPDVLVDIDQYVRSSDAEYDIGAHEFPSEESSLALIQVEDLSYAGAFLIPGNTQGASSANYSAGVIAHNNATNSMYLAGHSHHDAIAEFSIPVLVESTDISELNTATFMQDFTTVLGDTQDGNLESLDELSGMCFIDGHLYVNAVEYYDAPADNVTTTVVVEDPTELENSTISGFYKLEARAHAAGWISAIPEEWQSPLGGSYIAGNSSKFPIAGRHSIGPSAFVFDPSLMADNSTELIPTTTLLDFSLASPLHEDFSSYASDWYNLVEVNGTTEGGHTFQDADAIVGSNALWTSSSQASYGFIVPGTSTYLTIGSSGGHNSGIGYKATQDNGNLCGGPCSYAANDVYNYYWLWDVNDLVKVKNGDMAPNDVRPYNYGEISIPFQHDAYSDTPEFHEVTGGTYDPATGLLYLTVYDGGTPASSAYGRVPAIATYRINTQLGEEVKDGVDNNGDGRIDEQLINKWIGPSTGMWHESPSNWSSGHIPNDNNIVVIGADCTVTVPGGAEAKAFSVKLLGGGQLIIPESAALTLTE